jgi:predicted dehydrogenase
MSSRLRFGIVGTGLIADVIADAIHDVEEAELAAVASRRREGAEDFAGRHGGPRVFDSWRELVASDAVDAVYVATPTAVREEISVAAAQNGKHVLAEKPFAGLGSLERITSACRDRGVAFMDATHFVHHPRTAKLKRELEDRIGGVQAVRTCFFFPSMDRSNIRFDPQKEPTGAIGDMAWYSMRAIIEYMPGEGKLAGAGGFAQRDGETGAVIRGSGFLVFSDGRTSTWDAGYNVGALAMDLDLLGHRGMISLDDFVLDWAGGFAPGDPGHAVGFTQRSGVTTPAGFERVATPSPERATVLMIRSFVALTGDPSGVAAAASIDVSERTQGLVDAVWARLE